VNPSVVEQLETSGMLFVGHDDDGKRMEIMELQGTVYSLSPLFSVPIICYCVLFCCWERCHTACTCDRKLCV